MICSMVHVQSNMMNMREVQLDFLARPTPQHVLHQHGGICSAQTQAYVVPAHHHITKANENGKEICGSHR